jgi:starvation-inducible DNA-binding protein
MDDFAEPGETQLRMQHSRKDTPTMAKAKDKARPAKGKNGAAGNSRALASADGARTFETAIDLPAQTREAMTALLNQTLADTSDLYSQTKQAHWNVKGIHFYPLHLLFDELAEHREDEADNIAERAVQLGGYATGTVRMAAAASQLPELPTDINSGEDYVRALVDRYGQHANTLREGIDTADQAGDADSADLLTEISRQVDKDLWFLQAHLQA